MPLSHRDVRSVSLDGWHQVAALCDMMRNAWNNYPSNWTHTSTVPESPPRIKLISSLSPKYKNSSILGGGLWLLTEVFFYRQFRSLQLLAELNCAFTGSLPQILFPARLGFSRNARFLSSKYLSIAALHSSTDS